MSDEKQYFALNVQGTSGKCPVGKKVANQNMTNGKIPLFSCEGACIRGEIARQAANIVAKEEQFSRGCHGETFAVPHSAMAQWVKNANKVMLIDGCFLRCHGRIMRNLVEEGKLVEFDALSHYKKYTDMFDIDSIPEAERKEVARDVANGEIEEL